jgi:hypothetical protein
MSHRRSFTHFDAAENSTAQMFVPLVNVALLNEPPEPNSALPHVVVSGCQRYIVVLTVQ